MFKKLCDIFGALKGQKKKKKKKKNKKNDSSIYPMF